MMQSKTIFIAISLLFAVALSACDKPGPAEQAGEKIDQVASDTGKAIGETVDKVDQKMTEQGEKTTQMVDDSQITALVKTDLLSEPGLKSMQISVNTVKGVVTLTGMVDSQANSDLARTRTLAINGVTEVNNQLVVTPAK